MVYYYIICNVFLKDWSYKYNAYQKDRLHFDAQLQSQANSQSKLDSGHLIDMLSSLGCIEHMFRIISKFMCFSCSL